MVYGAQDQRESSQTGILHQFMVSQCPDAAFAWKVRCGSQEIVQKKAKRFLFLFWLKETGASKTYRYQPPHTLEGGLESYVRKCPILGKK